MTTAYYRMTDVDLRDWAAGLSRTVEADPAAFRVSPQQIAVFTLRSDDFAQKLAAWTEPQTRTQVASTAKAEARRRLLDEAGCLVAMINRNPATTDEQRAQLRLNVRKKKARIAAPSSKPALGVMQTVGRWVTLRLRDAETGRIGKPRGVAGAQVLIAYGPEAPTDPQRWIGRGMVTRPRFDLHFDEQTTAGMVWVTAYFFSGRGQAGPGCTPIGISLPATVPVPGRIALRVAA